MFPGACSRVSLTALESAGADYDAVTIDLINGAQKRPRYLEVNPQGKVPALLVEGKLLTENAAILTWLNDRYPDAKLLPSPSDDIDRARLLADLFWLSATWHPYVRAIRAPMRWTTGDVTPVQERGREILAFCMTLLEERLAKQEWWYEHWSILDVYFFWCYTTAEAGGFSLDPYPHAARHRRAIDSLPALRRALEREATAPVQT
jgi:glutathione S-transferase